MKTIKLVWLDGKIERVDVEDYRREEGVLVLTLRIPPLPLYPLHQPARVER